jgi:hypothetical protein
MKILFVAAATCLILVGCAPTPAHLGQAERECRSEGLAPGNPGYEDCVRRVLDGIYESWTRDTRSRGQ